MKWCEAPGIWLGHEVLERYGCRMADGLVLTLKLVGISSTLGFVLAIGLGLLRLRGPKPVRYAIAGYTTFFRGTPLLCQLFLIYYGLGTFRVFWQEIGLWWFFRAVLLLPPRLHHQHCGLSGGDHPRLAAGPAEGPGRGGPRLGHAANRDLPEDRDATGAADRPAPARQ